MDTTGNFLPYVKLHRMDFALIVSSAASTRIGRRLRLLRLAMGFSQQGRFALFLSRPPADADHATRGAWPTVSLQRWNNYESGRQRLTPEIALALCDKTDCTLDWLYRGKLGQMPNSLLERMDQARIRYGDTE